MAKLRFGTGGVPHTAKGVDKGIERLHELGLEHMELEFVQSVFLTEEKAEKTKQLAEENDITLTVHGSYYTNFASEDTKKWHASISRIEKAAEIGYLAGAKSVTYHSGFFQGKSYDEVRERVIKAMEKLFAQLTEKDVKGIDIAPELTGKATQVGDIDQLIDIVSTLQSRGHTQAALCIDFAHKYARDNGAYNSYDEFMELIDKIATGLGTEFLEKLHIHISAIQYGDKGEKNHLVMLSDLESYKAEGVEVEGIESAWKGLKKNRLEENKFQWRELLKALKKSNVGGFVVCESPILELDALLMQKYYESV